MEHNFIVEKVVMQSYQGFRVLHR